MPRTLATLLGPAVLALSLTAAVAGPMNAPLTVATDLVGARVTAGGAPVALQDGRGEAEVIPGPCVLTLSDGVGRIERALEVGREGASAALSIADLTAEELHALGDAHLRAGDRAGAATYFARAVERAPASVGYRNDLGIALHLAERYDEARAALEQAVRLDPQSAETHFNLAGVLVSLDRREAAVWEYQQARRLRPDDPAIRNDLAATLMELGFAERAEMEYRGVLDGHAQYAPAWFGYAVVLEQNGKGGLAREAWTTYLRLAETYDEELTRIAKEHLAALVPVVATKG
jgi:tetratricopeptide (TPR) repeat protein